MIEFERDDVDVAEPPTLAGFEGADQRVAGLPVMTGCVATGRAVAASDVAAADANPEVHPISFARSDALGAAIGRPRVWKDRHLGRHMYTRCSHGLATRIEGRRFDHPSTAGVAAPLVFLQSLGVDQIRIVGMAPDPAADKRTSWDDGQVSVREIDRLGAGRVLADIVLNEVLGLVQVGGR